MLTVLLVFVGGALGTSVRWALGAALPFGGGLPVTFAINISGALLLGILTEALRPIAHAHRGQLTLAFAGTGALGGYTTYGMFAIDTDGLIDTARLGDGVLYGGLGILVGVAAAGAGMAAVHAIRSSRSRKQVVK